MKQVLEIYGKFLLDAAVVVMLMVLLFLGVEDGQGNRGVFHIIGAKLQGVEMEEDGGSDFSVYEQESLRASPVITYVGERAFETGKYQVADCIQAASAEGEYLPVTLLGMVLPGGEEMHQVSSQELVFDKPGIYQLKVQAIDSRRKKTVNWIAVPVNRRR